jgi:hypothetical protein
MISPLYSSKEYDAKLLHKGQRIGAASKEKAYATEQYFR